MPMSSWLRSTRSLFVPSGIEKGHRHTRLRKRSLAAPLSVEWLEDRTVLSTFTVHNLADSGVDSLRQAVLDANINPGADLIRFAGGLHGTRVAWYFFMCPYAGTSHNLKGAATWPSQPRRRRT